MLAKRFRLPIQSFVGKRGKLKKSSYFLIKIFTAETVFSRFGITISAKTAPKATERNRLKRSAYNFFKESGRELPIADYWITVLRPAVNLPKEGFIRELSKILNG